MILTFSYNLANFTTSNYYRKGEMLSAGQQTQTYVSHICS